MEVSEQFYSASLTELKQGFVYDEATESYYCLICGEQVEEGVVYPVEKRFLEAHKYVKHHISSAHGSMLDYLLQLDKKATGLTDLQKQLIEAFASGKSDADTVKLTGAGSASTIRNHRFALKEKAKQAKLFLAILELMDTGLPAGAKFVPINRNAPQVDERYALTHDEYNALLLKYLPQGLSGPLTGLPRKEKRKAALLRHIATSFRKGRKYKEAEVDDILKRFMDEEYVTLRRYLIDYGFLSRESDGSIYWLTV
ncbi:transcriptional regulator [Paenibacillus baekrokdamisoli]|uniref:Transcriptional regulator n=1 Tax=Paenibacillus baekrokdamisoli TaxID=1712516 RepID=A0A3G9JFL6_9BACL|nr:DUF2087 domain-containing protein [Paenibacillus baekrokdamisoli]MBB3071533.1 hypothetical protein [Paenibacillus baekrokdamisoli]BBH21954.1 transcriptional regulator [Paenibacillus baekrokdamisoli]